MMKRFQVVVVLVAIALITTSVQAAFVMDIDTDGLDNGVLTYHPNFSFGGDTTSASQSDVCGAAGLTGGDSIFGGNGSTLLDTYIYTYTPSTDADNYTSTLVGGGLGTYRVYVAWPSSANVSGGVTTYTISTAGETDVVVRIDQDANGADPTGGDWVVVGDIDYSVLNSTITLTQVAGTNSYVSMRGAGMKVELVPEPATMALLGLGGLLLRSRRRR